MHGTELVNQLLHANPRVRRNARRLWRGTLRRAGRFLPHAVKLPLARWSPRMGFLLLDDEDFVIDDYLGDLKLNIRADHEIERVALAGRYEPEVLRVIEEHVHPGDYCIDVGANSGAISLALAKRVGGKGRVFCFEPVPPYFKRLDANVRLNPLLAERMVLIQKGLSDREGTLLWGEDPEYPGNAYLLGRRGAPVPVTTIDITLADRLPRLDFIKIDVEGMEHFVLRGAAETLRRHRPRILFETLMQLETEGNPIRKIAADFLLSLGYRLYRLHPDGSLTPTEYPHFGSNALAIPGI